MHVVQPGLVAVVRGCRMDGCGRTQRVDTRCAQHRAVNAQLQVQGHLREPAACHAHVIKQEAQLVTGVCTPLLDDFLPQNALGELHKLCDWICVCTEIARRAHCLQNLGEPPRERVATDQRTGRAPQVFHRELRRIHIHAAGGYSLQVQDRWTPRKREPRVMVKHRKVEVDVQLCDCERDRLGEQRVDGKLQALAQASCRDVARDDHIDMPMVAARRSAACHTARYRRALFQRCHHHLHQNVCEGRLLEQGLEHADAVDVGVLGRSRRLIQCRGQGRRERRLVILVQRLVQVDGAALHHSVHGARHELVHQRPAPRAEVVHGHGHPAMAKFHREVALKIRPSSRRHVHHHDDVPFCAGKLRAKGIDDVHRVTDGHVIALQWVALDHKHLGTVRPKECRQLVCHLRRAGELHDRKHLACRGDAIEVGGIQVADGAPRKDQQILAAGLGRSEAHGLHDRSQVALRIEVVGHDIAEELTAGDREWERDHRQPFTQRRLRGHGAVVEV